MRRITSRFVMLIATAAVAPLVAYGVVSIYQLRSGTEQSVGDGNQRVARQVSEQIRQYITHNERVLKSAGIELRMTGLEEWQRTRILKDYVIDFPEFREISLFDQGGRVMATSRFGPPRVSLPDSTSVTADGVYVAPIKMDDDALPTTTIAVRVTPPDEEAVWVVAEISLEELWRMRGILLLAYVSGLMFVMRHFAGPLVKRLSNVGLLIFSAAFATVGLYALSFARRIMACGM